MRLLGVGEKEWTFKTTFTASDDDLKAPNADLVFDGLDTFATVTLVRTDAQDRLVFTDFQPTEWCENLGVCNRKYAFMTKNVLTSL